MKYYYIYEITNKINGKRYRGQHTTTNLDDGYMGSGSALHRAFKKYGIENFQKDIIMFCTDPDDLNCWEALMVDEYWVARKDTYNLVVGGQGGFSKEASSKGGKIQGKIQGKKNVESGWIASLGKIAMQKMTKEQRSKGGKIGGKIGIQKMTFEQRSTGGKNSAKPLLQYTKSGEFIKEWDSASEVQRQLGINNGNISSCCTGCRKYAGGFVWKYKYYLI